MITIRRHMYDRPQAGAKFFAIATHISEKFGPPIIRIDGCWMLLEWDFGGIPK